MKYFFASMGLLIASAAEDLADYLDQPIMLLKAMGMILIVSILFAALGIMIEREI